MIPTTYPPDFEIAIEQSLRHEGGYSNHSADSGGATNMGVTARSLADYNKRHGYDWTIPTLSRAQVREFYFDEYWIPLRLMEIANQGVKNVLLATAINTGKDLAVRKMQALVCATVDGRLGQNTLALINHYPDPIFLVNNYCDSIKQYYGDLVKRRPKDLVFYKGWTKRINSFRIA
jgi:lysozyme family protein